MRNVVTIISNWIEEHTGFIIALSLLVLGLFFLLKLNSGNTPTSGVFVKHDTTVIIRYENTQTDTVIKWYERIIRVNPVSDTIYVQKVDSVFVEQTRYKDVMLSIKKSKDHLTIFALNEKDSVINEYNYDNVYNNFSAVSAYRNVFVKASAFEWTGINTSLSFRRKLESRLALNNILKEVPDIAVSLRSGITFKNRLTLNAELQYDLNQATPKTEHPKPMLGIELTYKIIK